MNASKFHDQNQHIVPEEQNGQNGQMTQGLPINGIMRDVTPGFPDNFSNLNEIQPKQKSSLNKSEFSEANLILADKNISEQNLVKEMLKVPQKNLISEDQICTKQLSSSNENNKSSQASNMFYDIQNGLNHSQKRKADMVVEENTCVELLKPTVQNSGNLTPCSTDVVGPVENPEVDKLNKRNQKASDKLNSQFNTSTRPKRDVKKTNRPDELYENDFPDMSEKVSRKTPKSLNIKHQKIDDNKDPVAQMFKYIMEPIIVYDRLDVLQRDKVQFEIKLKAKDFKNLSRERKEDMLSQRVNFEQHDGFVIQLDLDPTFERHIEPYGSQLLSSSDLKGDSKTPSTDAIDNDENISGEEENAQSADEKLQANGTTEDQEMQKSGVEDQVNSATEFGFKKPLIKKKKKKKGFTPQYKRISSINSKKPYQTHLPNSIRDCTWIENTEDNIIILQQKNEEILKRREQKKLEELRKNEEFAAQLSAQGINPLIENFKMSHERDDLDIKMIKSNEKIAHNDQTQKTQIDFQLNEEKQPNIELENSDEKLNQLSQPEDNDEHFKQVQNQNLISIEQISYKYSNNYYHNLDRLLSDYTKLITNTIKKRSKNQLAKVYLTNLLLNAQKTIGGAKKEWRKKWVTFYQIKLANNSVSNCLVGGDNYEIWYNKFDESTKRQYFEIEDYKIQVPGNIENNGQYNRQQQREVQRIVDIMSTSKTSKCTGECCIDPINKNDQQPENAILGVQNHKCSCCKTKTECSDECGCDPERCLNRQMTRKQSLQLGLDVEEKISWGMDTCTAVNFISICPRDVDRSNFVEKKLIYAIQQQGEQGFNVLNALQYIINSDLNDPIISQKYDVKDQEIAQTLCDAIENLPDKNVRHFRIHSKGLGIFCKNINGIRNDSLVIEYFGEIYRQWHWFEKQDVIKKGQNENKLNKGLPDFYNITFERHLDDPDGYNIMTVDPIIHGNYSSRLSHSCSPNCQTINKVRSGKYSIGMFTNKDITYGEELCFDYCSFTESQVEFDEAVCLCGTSLCKSKYLTLSNDKNNLQIMKNHHTFIDRNFLIFKAVTQSELTDEDKSRLHANGLSNSVLNCAPLWLQKWASLVCEYLEFEEQIFPETFKGDYPKGMKLEHIKIDARGQRDTQVQNIAITIDKIMHVLESMKTYDPPIRVLSFEERFKKLWEEQDCVKQQVKKVLDEIEPEWDSQVDQAKSLLKGQDTQTIQLLMGSDEQMEVIFKEKYDKIRKILENISNILRSVNSQKVPIPAFCDVLMMYAYTETYFTQNQNYRKCDSDIVLIRNCDVRHKQGALMDKENQSKHVYKNNKEYDSQYVWGQLVGWNKQTVEQPNASLSADRRGTLSIPDITSFENYDRIAKFSQTTTIKRHGKRQDSDEVIVPSAGSRSRPLNTTMVQPVIPMTITQQTPQALVDQAVTQTQITIRNQTQDFEPEFVTKQPIRSGNTKWNKIVYPSKRFSKRQEFLSNWKDTFSKQFDVCCKWQFKNKFKMYGSIQFESVVKSDKQIYKMQARSKEEQIQRYQMHNEQRLEYFDEIVSKMLNYKHE